MKFSAIIVLCTSVIIACNPKATPQQPKEKPQTKKDSIVLTPEYYELNYDSLPKFDRKEIKQKLQQKIDAGEPLLVHLLVPLCDNENQGIVPVHKSLGDGTNLNTNLYWGAGYGIKTHFNRRLKSWKLLKQQPDKDSVVLERLIFKKIYPNGTTVLLVADAYRGDKMQQCLTDYFDALSGRYTDAFHIDSVVYDIGKKADLVIFNGHNGLMDTRVDYLPPPSEQPKDAAVIACASVYYFNHRLLAVNAYPYLMTQELLPPEAYIAEALIDSWAMLQPPEESLNAAGDAVARIHKKSKTACRRLFCTGWSFEN